MTAAADKTIIIGLASDLTLAQLKPFFLSLEKVGYQGDICTFVSHWDRPALDFLRARRVNLVPFQRAYPEIQERLLRVLT